MQIFLFFALFLLIIGIIRGIAISSRKSWKISMEDSETGSSRYVGRGHKVGDAAIDLFDKVYYNMPANPKEQTLRDRLKDLNCILDEYGKKMSIHDRNSCQERIYPLEQQLEEMESQRKAKEDEKADKERIRRQRMKEAEKRRKQKEKGRLEYLAALPERQKFIAQQRNLMSASMRYEVLRRDSFRCQLCGASASDGVLLHVDHIIPVSKGGKTEFSNLRTLCDRCNLGKGDKIEVLPENRKKPQPLLSQLHARAEKETPEYYKTVADFLQKKGFVYIDTTPNGGSIYFFDEDMVQEISDMGYTVKYAKNGTRKTGFRPAWYVK